MAALRWVLLSSITVVGASSPLLSFVVPLDSSTACCRGHAVSLSVRLADIVTLYSWQGLPAANAVSGFLVESVVRPTHLKWLSGECMAIYIV